MTSDRPAGPYVQPDGFCAASQKYGWDDEATAEDALKAARSRGMGKGGRIENRVYLCPWCRRYHLTSKATHLEAD